MSELILVRGLPGSGKTTFGYKISLEVHAADDYFEKSGSYVFDANKLPEAHADCQERVGNALEANDGPVVVTNTFSCRWEMEPYFQMGARHGADVTVVDLFDAGMLDIWLAERGLHNVPVNKIHEMRQRWEHNWGNGNPLPPWER
mgnify:CR=1 FL=1